jgi:hypothetical protein
MLLPFAIAVKFFSMLQRGQWQGRQEQWHGNEEGDGNGSKSNCNAMATKDGAGDSNKEGKDEGCMRENNGDKEGRGKGGKRDGNGDKEVEGKGGKRHGTGN